MKEFEEYLNIIKDDIIESLRKDHPRIFAKIIIKLKGGKK